MKKNWIILLFLCIVCGCFSPKVQVGSESYFALTEKEKQQLVSRATYYLKKNPRLLSKSELGILPQLEPLLKLDYYGDRNGKAEITWRMRKRIITVVIEGDFLDQYAKCWVEIEDIAPDVIEFRGNKGTKK